MRDVLQKHRHGFMLCDFARCKAIYAQREDYVRRGLNVASAVTLLSE
jgi:uncharacterized C2H2 Zn-finger protein